MSIADGPRTPPPALAMLDTVPKTLTEGLRAFCATLSDARPVFVRCRPDGDAQPSGCFDNVARKIGRAGGSIVHGWAIWTVPGFYHEAEHHGVWRRRTGELVDVSPQPNAPKRILFLPDEAAVYDPVVHRDNVLRAASDDPLAHEFVALGSRRNAIHATYRIGGARLVSFSAADRMELGEIERRLRELGATMMRARREDPTPGRPSREKP